MREIKFRAWDGEVMHTKLEMSGFDDVNELFVFAAKHGAVLVQYTGLKDKNGVEIYEGDILKETIRNLDSPDGICNRIWPVTWGTEFAGFNVGVAPHWSVLNPIDTQRMEVIGNIHENPELLEGATRE